MMQSYKASGLLYGDEQGGSLQKEITASMSLSNIVNEEASWKFNAGLQKSKKDIKKEQDE